MKAIVNTAPDRLELLEVPTPTPGSGQVRIRTAACGICATDLEMVAGWKRTGFPSIPGHEWSGIVDAVGAGADKTLIGKKCVGDNVQADGGEIGFEHPGGYGEYLVTRAANLQILPEGFPLHVAALIEPLAVSVRGLSRLRPDAKGPILIIGDGPIGLLMCMQLRRRGHAITLVGGRPERLALALTLGVSRCLNYHEFPGGLSDGIIAATAMQFPTIVECSGSGDAMDACLALAAKEGRILMVGDYAQRAAGFQWNKVLWQEIELIGTNASAGAWKDAVGLAVGGGLPLDKLITHRIPATGFAHGYALVRERNSRAIKVVMEWE